MKPKLPSFDAMIRNQGICLATEGRSQNTIDWYASNLRRFLQFLNNRQLPDSIEGIGIREVRDFIFYLQNEVTRWESSPYTRDGRRLSPFSVQGYVRAIKAFWSWLMAEGYIQNNPMEKLKIPKVPRKVIATFSPEQRPSDLKGSDLQKGFPLDDAWAGRIRRRFSQSTVGISLVIDPSHR
ncbi:tyrosine-type recombinase/integrase [Chloroflexota bacterium]